MTIMFNPGYIGPNPPCCDTDLTDENECPNAECGPCPGPRAPCGGCSPEKTQMPAAQSYIGCPESQSKPPKLSNNPAFRSEYFKGCCEENPCGPPKCLGPKTRAEVDTVCKDIPSRLPKTTSNATNTDQQLSQLTIHIVVETP